MLGGPPDYADCPDCGTSVPLDGIRPHRCDERHRADRIAAIALSAVERFEHQLGEYLETPQGRFELFYAARERGAR